MNQQPDKFFREKLEGYQKPISASAWTRLENKLDKKKPDVQWLKYAAAVLLLVSASLWWINREPEATHVIAREEKTPPAIKNQASVNQDSVHEHMADSDKEMVAEVQTPEKITKQRPTSPTKAKHEELDVPIVADNTPKENKTLDDPSSGLAVLPDLALTEETPVQEKHDVEKEKNNITLVYTAEEVDNKYLDKKSLAEATRQDKKPSTLKKLLEKAYDLKHNQDAFGELRQKKNEMLALNFKNEKERSQNR